MNTRDDAAERRQRSPFYQTAKGFRKPVDEGMYIGTLADVIPYWSKSGKPYCRFLLTYHKPGGGAGDCAFPVANMSGGPTGAEEHASQDRSPFKVGVFMEGVLGRTITPDDDVCKLVGTPVYYEVEHEKEGDYVGRANVVAIVPIAALEREPDSEPEEIENAHAQAEEVVDYTRSSNDARRLEEWEAGPQSEPTGEDIAAAEVPQPAADSAARPETQAGQPAADDPGEPIEF